MAAQTVDPLPDNPGPTDRLDIPTRVMISQKIGSHVDVLHRLGKTRQTAIAEARKILAEYGDDPIGEHELCYLAACFQLCVEQTAAYHKAAM